MAKRVFSLYPMFMVFVPLLVLAVTWGGVHLFDSREPLIDFADTEKETAALSERGNVPASLRFAVASMVSAEITFSTYKRLVHRICRDVGLRETFIIRTSYADVRRALEENEVDVAFVCTGTYLHIQPAKKAKLLVQPEFETKLQYRSLLIVPADSAVQNLDDLKDTAIAFTDPESLTGCIVPSVLFREKDYLLDRFFKKIIYTGGHNRSIFAVARKIVDVAAVDSLIWDSNLREDPDLEQSVRIIWQSPAFGPPPVMVPSLQSPEMEKALQKAFMSLDKDEEGRQILSAIGIRRFIMPHPEDYSTADEYYKTFLSKKEDLNP